MCKTVFKYSDIGPLAEFERRKFGLKRVEDNVEDALEKKENELLALEADTLLLKIENDQSTFRIYKSHLDMWETQSIVKNAEYLEVRMFCQRDERHMI